MGQETDLGLDGYAEVLLAADGPANSTDTAIGTVEWYLLTERCNQMEIKPLNHCFSNSQ